MIFDTLKLLIISNNFLINFLYLNLYCKILSKNIEFYNDERFKLIKYTSNNLCNLNVNYLKIIQSLCLQKDFLIKREQEYLLKYTNNVPYNCKDVDYEIINFLKNENIIFDKS